MLIFNVQVILILKRLVIKSVNKDNIIECKDGDESQCLKVEKVLINK